MNYASFYNLIGFLYAGKPGLLCIKGKPQNIDDYMEFLKTVVTGSTLQQASCARKKQDEASQENRYARVQFSQIGQCGWTVCFRRLKQRIAI